jgi:hypothetical protein
MKTYSGEQLPKFQVSGTELRIHWDAKEVESPNGTQWEQEEAVCHVQDPYGTLVAKIIGAVYDHNAEFAAINDGGEQKDDYMAFRLVAKQLAKDYIDSK